jgi:hypothetical protein
VNLVKIQIIMFVLILLCSNLSAIDEKGVKVGFSYSTLTGSEMTNAEFRSNFSAGLFVNKRLNSWLILQSELLYSSKGAIYNGTERLYTDNDMDGYFDEDPYDQIDNDGDGLIDEDQPELDFNVSGYYKLYYIEIPILLKMTTEHFISNNLNIILGPSFNILLDDKNKLKQDGYEYLNGHLSDLNTFDLSAIFGVEYSINKFIFELRVNQGLIQNKFKSVSETFIEDFPDLFILLIGEDYQEYVKGRENYGYNTSFSVFLSVLF